MGEAIKELMPLLQKVADKLDSSAQYLWALQLQQVKVQIIKIALLDVLVLISFYGVYLFYKYMQEEVTNCNRVTVKRSEEQEVLGIVGGVVCGLVIIIGLASFIVSISSLPTMILNPEYWALQEIMKMVK
jgi:hypothetical protein